MEDDEADTVAVVSASLGCIMARPNFNLFLKHRVGRMKCAGAGELLWAAWGAMTR